MVKDLRKEYLNYIKQPKITKGKSRVFMKRILESIKENGVESTFRDVNGLNKPVDYTIVNLKKKKPTQEVIEKYEKIVKSKLLCNYCHLWKSRVDCFKLDPEVKDGIVCIECTCKYFSRSKVKSLRPLDEENEDSERAICVSSHHILDRWHFIKVGIINYKYTNTCIFCSNKKACYRNVLRE